MEHNNDEDLSHYPIRIVFPHRPRHGRWCDPVVVVSMEVTPFLFWHNESPLLWGRFDLHRNCEGFSLGIIDAAIDRASAAEVRFLHEAGAGAITDGSARM
jgi:hypothetical protein